MRTTQVIKLSLHGVNRDLAVRCAVCGVPRLGVLRSMHEHLVTTHPFSRNHSDSCACACREAIALSPGHHRALKLLGSALYALGDLPGAQEALRASLAVSPAYADASCDLGARACCRWLWPAFFVSGVVLR